MIELLNSLLLLTTIGIFGSEMIQALDSLFCIAEKTQFIYILIGQSESDVMEAQDQNICHYRREVIQRHTCPLLPCSTPTLGQFVKVLQAESDIDLKLAELYVYGY